MGTQKRKKATMGHKISRGLNRATNFMQSTNTKSPIRRNWLLSTWLMVHILLIIPSIMLLLFLLDMRMGYPYTRIFSLALMDACLQLIFIYLLWKNRPIGLYGLFLLFLLRIFLSPLLNLVDALWLCIAVYTSSVKTDSGKVKLKGA